MRKKVGDGVIVKSKYFHPLNDIEGVIEEIVDPEYEIIVKMDHDDKLYTFNKYELKKKL